MSGVDVLERITKLESLVRERADEAERNGNLSDDVFTAMKAAGCFRACVPAAYGGDEATLPEHLASLVELSRFDGATGWVAMILGTAPIVMARFPRPTFDFIYRDSADVIGAGTLAPKGRADVVEGGYRVTGQWPFGSGSHFAEWIVVHCLVFEDDELKMAESGPELRLMLLPRDDVEILDTWHVAGLKGTGSNDLRVADVFVPGEHSGPLFSGEPCVDSPLLRIPVLSQFGLDIAACAVGIARGAFESVLELAKTKRPAFKPMQRVAEDTVARFELGRTDLVLDAASALLEHHAGKLWREAESGAIAPAVERARTRAAAWQITRMCLQVVEDAYMIGGGTSVYESSDLQRRMRDMHALTQHAAVSRDAAVWLGGFLTGEPVPDARI